MSSANALTAITTSASSILVPSTSSLIISSTIESNIVLSFFLSPVTSYSSPSTVNFFSPFAIASFLAPVNLFCSATLAPNILIPFPTASSSKLFRKPTTASLLFSVTLAKDSNFSSIACRLSLPDNSTPHSLASSLSKESLRSVSGIYSPSSSILSCVPPHDST